MSRCCTETAAYRVWIQKKHDKLASKIEKSIESDRRVLARLPIIGGLFLRYYNWKARRLYAAFRSVKERYDASRRSQMYEQSQLVPASGVFGDGKVAL